MKFETTYGPKAPLSVDMPEGKQKEQRVMGYNTGEKKCFGLRGASCKKLYNTHGTAIEPGNVTFFQRGTAAAH